MLGDVELPTELAGKVLKFYLFERHCRLFVDHTCFLLVQVLDLRINQQFFHAPSRALARVVDTLHLNERIQTPVEIVGSVSCHFLHDETALIAVIEAEFAGLASVKQLHRLLV